MMNVSDSTVSSNFVGLTSKLSYETMALDESHTSFDTKRFGLRTLRKTHRNR